MTLDEKQKQQVAAWIETGLKLSEIQSRLASELGLKLTYLEVRFLVDDLNLTLKEKEPPEAKPAPPVEVRPTDLTGKPASPGQREPPAPTTGGVTVSVDTLTKPGSLVSGKVTFSDGKTADWYLDQMGRLGLVPKTEGYRPSAADLQEFQMALEREITRAGY
ncbi:MAG: hypothetical protein MUE94_13295 [Verrucomicrobia bacterium]|jgi:hypothetical protein|nr:hypothetical protein [Verrucomicrobiota bacterium]